MPLKRESAFWGAASSPLRAQCLQHESHARSQGCPAGGKWGGGEGRGRGNLCFPLNFFFFARNLKLLFKKKPT